MFLPLLPLLFAGASADSPLVENFECGPERYAGLLKLGAAFTIDRCIDPVRDGANLCCKAHDLCFDVHSMTGYTRQYCDDRFCNCLQDVSDRTKNNQCSHPLENFCHMARHFGEPSFQGASPNPHKGAFRDFVDHKPLGLDMQKLVNTCEYSKGIAIHCHNAAHTCLGSDHAKFKRMEEGIVEHPYQDCHSTMYHCLQMIVDFEPDQKCIVLADSMAKQVNTYTELDENTHGKAVIEAYPIAVARLLKQCNESTAAILPCLTSFHNCSSTNRQDRPELFSKIRQIKAKCHRELSYCIGEATMTETEEDCVVARTVAIGSFRQTELKTDHKWYEEGVAAIATYVETFDHGKNKLLEAVGEKAKDLADGVKDLSGKAVDKVKEAWENRPWYLGGSRH